jgi:DNA-binding protein HU-beta
MTKAELIARAAEKAGVSKKQADRCLKAFIEVITDALQKGEKIAIPGFGPSTTITTAEPRTLALINLFSPMKMATRGLVFRISRWSELASEI